MPIREITGVNDGSDLFIDGTNSTVTQSNSQITRNNSSAEGGGSSLANTGYSRTSAFVDGSVPYTQSDVDASLFKVFSLNEANHLSNDNPYWSTPTPSGVTGIGLFQGANLPEGVTS